MREILKGVVDLHVHAGPSVANRSVDAAEMLRSAVNAGYRGFVVKDHYFPTMMSATLVEKHLNSVENPVRVWGGICLNNSVGGFNVLAVDAAVSMGAKFVWFPTVSTNNHIESHKGHAFAGSGKMSVAEDPIIYIDENGALIPEAKAVIEYLKDKPDVILATGHGTAKEVDALVTEARAAGVDKVFVNHPYFMIGATMEDIAKWAKLGAYIEMDVGVVKGLSAEGPLPLDTFKELMQVVPIEQIVLDSDFGQKVNGDPVEKYYQALTAMLENGFTEEQIDIMAKKNPARLAGLDR